MKAIHNLTIDIVRRTITPIIHAMQFDTDTRIVQVQMLCDGEAWEPPAGSTVSLSYRKPDGTRGFYNRLSDDVSAVSVEGNAVAVVLAHQVLTVPGRVAAAVVVHSGGLRLAAFPFEICVTPDPGAGTTASDDYFNSGLGTGPRRLKSWAITESGNTVTLDYTLEGEDVHTDVITFDANGYPTSIDHDGFVANGTWTEAASSE